MDPIYELIVKARIKLLLEKPFYGHLATRLIVVDATSWCKTAATDGRHLFYNRDFIKSLKRPELMFLLAHEVLHCVLDHLGRRGSRDKDLYNVACDLLINWILRNGDNKVGEMTGPLATGCYDEKYDDKWTSEEIYEDLKKNQIKLQIPFDEHLDLGNDAPDQGKKKKKKNKKQQGNKGDQQDEDGSGGEGGEQDGSGGDGEGDEDGEGEGQGSGSGGQRMIEVTVTGKDGPPVLSEEELQKIRDEVKSALIQTVQAMGAGNVPMGVRRLIESLLAPKLDWRTLLDAHIRSALKDDYSFQRLSRRSWGSGFLLPSQTEMDRVEVFIPIDASGSMSNEMLRDMLSEVKGIMETFRDFKLDVVTFDTEVYDHWTFTPENIDDIHNYPCNGGGGTAFECVWEYMKRENIEPHRLVMFTDGLPGGTWGDPNYCDTMFVVHTTKNVAPFGATVFYEPRNQSTGFKVIEHEPA